MFNRSVNKVVLVGNLGKDPEMKYMPNGSAVANLTIATSESWKDKQTGEKKEKTEWHRVTVFQRLGEMCGEYLKKGGKIYVEGKLQTRKWQDQQGQDKYTTEIIADKVEMMDKGEQQGQQAPAPAQQQTAPRQQTAPQMAPAYQQAPAQNAPTQRAPQAAPVPHNPATQNPHQQPAPAQYNEPSMDFDDDIPFAPIGLQYPALLLSI